MKKERPETLQSTTYKVPSGFGNIYICVSTLDDQPFEVFVIVGKAGSDIQAKAEAVGRMVSLALRNEIPLNARKSNNALEGYSYLEHPRRSSEDIDEILHHERRGRCNE